MTVVAKEIEVPCDESVFTPKLPEGSFVVDQINRVKYRIGVEGQKSGEETKLPGRPAPWLTTPRIVALSVAAVVCTIVLYRILRRHAFGR